MGLAVRALAALPMNATDRQITQTRDKALHPLLARIAERVAEEQQQRQRENVMASVSWRLPSEISDRDRKDAVVEIEKALDELPAGFKPAYKAPTTPSTTKIE
jgi:hypothetical protein